jgi:hypothetical protein
MNTSQAQVGLIAAASAPCMCGAFTSVKVESLLSALVLRYLFHQEDAGIRAVLKIPCCMLYL